MEPKDYVAKSLKSGELKCPARTPTIRRTGRATCSSGARTCWAHRQGPRVFPQAPARHRARRARQGPRRGGRDEAARRSRWHDEAPEGKLDLLVTLDFRMSTTCVYSDIVLPTATWYEKNDLNTSDMHPFIHPLTAAVDPVWESRSDWEIFKAIAQEVLRGGARGARRREGRGAHADPARHRRPRSRSRRREGLEEGRDASRSPARPCRPSPSSSATIPTSTSASPRSGR